MQFSDELIEAVQSRAPSGITFDRNETIKALEWAASTPMIILPTTAARRAAAIVLAMRKRSAEQPDQHLEAALRDQLAAATQVANDRGNAIEALLIENDKREEKINALTARGDKLEKLLARMGDLGNVIYQQCEAALAPAGVTGTLRERL